MELGQERRPSRRFGLGDGLILMAALALTLVALRGTGWFARFPTRIAFWWEISLELLRQRPWSLPVANHWQAASMLAAQVIDEIFIGLLSSVLVGLTPIQPLVRLRHPRPPFREVIRQSGLVACLVVIVGVLVAADLWWIAGVNVAIPVAMTAAMVLPWPLYGLFPWRTEASWIDRLGRAVGWGWIIVFYSAVARLVL
jgi:hypothetical protein